MKKIAITLSASEHQHVINQKYIDFILNAGYTPVLIPQMSTEKDSNLEIIQTFAKECHGLLLPGGIDLEPTHYGEINYASQGCDPEKDDFERAVFYIFVKEKKPVFGICRGFQLIAREFLVNAKPESTRLLDFEQHVNNHNQGSLGAKRGTPTHAVRAVTRTLYNSNKSGSELTAIFVNSMHHQALRVTNLPEFMKAGCPVRLLAVTDYGLSNTGKNKSVIVEAFEIEDFMGSHVRAVQWHPEELKDTALLRSFFDERVLKDVRA